MITNRARARRVQTLKALDEDANVVRVYEYSADADPTSEEAADADAYAYSDGPAAMDDAGLAAIEVEAGAHFFANEHLL
eukprot:tig00020560_g11067.t1